MTDQFPPDPGDRGNAPVSPGSPASDSTATGSTASTSSTTASSASSTTAGPGPHRARNAPPPQVATELVDLVKQYAQQETVEPMRQLGLYLAWGLAGAVLLGLGAVFLAMSLLRALQYETGSTFTGKLIWIPYFIVVVVLAAVAWIAWQMRSRKREQTR